VESGSDRVNFRTEKRIVPLPLKQLEKKLGRAVSADQVRKILIALEFKLTPVAHGEVIQSFEVEVPSFRAGKDVSETADLIEEVARHSGYNTIPVEFPWVQLETPEFDAGRELTREIQDAFVASGYSEALTLSMLSQAAIEKTPERVAEALKIKNPPSEDFRYLRTSLLNTLLLAAEGNSKRLKNFRLFEVSNVFATNGEEKRQAVALCSGEGESFLRAKGAAEQLFERLKIPASFVPAVGESDFAHPGRVVQIKSNGRIIGEVAQLHPAIQKNFELPESAYVFVDLEALLKLKRAVVTSKALPKFPGIARDIAVVVSEKTLASEVESAILGADDRIADLKLFDVYSGKGIEIGKRSLAFSFEIRDSEKTLEDSEAEAVLQKIIAAVEGKGGSLRK
jgi:phenylalanyl-tRNA synthetase beta chain